MEFRKVGRGGRGQITEIFRSSFTTSEDEDEGKAVAALASKLCRTIDDEDIFCFAACEGATMVGAIFFTRLAFDADVRVFMLAPVAVLTSHQGRGVGTSLIRFGLSTMQACGVEVAVTYGDPAFYGKVGFQPLSETQLRAPMTLSMPYGWLGQSLTTGPIPVLGDRPKCVEAFNDPALW